MKLYLQKQIESNLKTKALTKLESRADPDASMNKVSAVPLGAEIDDEEEAYVKRALRKALDGQVERKEEAVESKGRPGWRRASSHEV